VADPEFWNKEGGGRVKISKNNAFCAKFVLGHKMHLVSKRGAPFLNPPLLQDIHRTQQKRDTKPKLNLRNKSLLSCVQHSLIKTLKNSVLLVAAGEKLGTKA